jgi:uncharacterized protein DUF4255
VSDVLFSTTVALKRRIEAATGIMTRVGAPDADDAGDGGISLTLFDVKPSAALRNVQRFAAAPTSGPVTGPAAQVEAIALDLRYLIVCFRAKGGPVGADPRELKTLGRIIAALHADSVLDATAAANDELPGPNPPQAEKDAAFAEQIVRLSLESYGLDDWNRLWALFPDISFRPSIVYLATPVYVTIGETALYPRVQSREDWTGISADPPRSDAA